MSSIVCPHCGKEIRFQDIEFAKSKRERVKLIKEFGHKAELEFCLYLEQLGWSIRLNSTPIRTVPRHPDVYAFQPSGKAYYFEVKSTLNRFGRVEAKQVKTLLKALNFFCGHIEEKCFVAMKFTTFGKWVVKNVIEPKTMILQPSDVSDEPFANPKVPSIKNWNEYLKTWHDYKKCCDLLEGLELDCEGSEPLSLNEKYRKIDNEVLLLARKLEKLLEANLS